MAKRRVRSKRPIKSQPQAARPKGIDSGYRSVNRERQHIVTHNVGALPIINDILERMKLHELLQRHLPREDKRSRVDAARVVLLLVRNVLVSREPIYGVVDWAKRYAPDLFDLWPDQLEHLNDDRVGRSLDRLFEAVGSQRSNLIMDVVLQVIREFDLQLDELHNDSTTVTLTGDYADAKQEKQLDELLLPAITWGHNKDHRPDLKQLLYTLTVTEDGGVPIYFHADSGNVTDDQTHQDTWKLMAELVQRPDFVYVADCKLASADNLNAIARLGGRFITVLPANRKESTAFRERLKSQRLRTPTQQRANNASEVDDAVCWQEVLRLVDEHVDRNGEIVEVVRDVFQVCTANGTDEYTSKEGYRLLWFHSRAKETRDAETRARKIERAERELEELQQRIDGPRTRFRSRKKIESAAEEILQSRGVGDFVKITIEETEQEAFRQTSRGRPNANTKYQRTVTKRFRLSWQLDGEQIETARAADGVFPLITNIRDWSAEDVLEAYKRQPTIEKRFSQLKNDFRAAPVYLKSVRRIVGLLTVYFFALMVQSLIERELRNSMQKSGVDSLPLYPEGRACLNPTTRKVIDAFEPIQRHLLQTPGDEDPPSFPTELAPIHLVILELMNISTEKFYVP